MYTIVICGFIFFIVTLVLLIIEAGGWDWDFLGLSLGIGLVGFIIGIIVALGIGAFCTEKSGCRIATQETIQLYSAYDKNNVAGSFFLGTGYIDETEYIYYWAEYDGGLKKYKTLEDNAVIYQENRTDAYGIFYYTSCKSDKLWLLCMQSSEPNRVDFHVPMGSVYFEYEFK